MLNFSNAKLIEEYETYPDNANSPTITKVYECACGKGTIEYVSVPGFDDRYTVINCEECKEKYTVCMGCGQIWELILR